MSKSDVNVSGTQAHGNSVRRWSLGIDSVQSHWTLDRCRLVTSAMKSDTATSAWLKNEHLYALRRPAQATSLTRMYDKWEQTSSTGVVIITSVDRLLRCINIPYISRSKWEILMAINIKKLSLGNTDIFDKLTVAQLVKKFAIFNGTRRFIAVFIGARKVNV
jgi:hypothetical protein